MIDIKFRASGSAPLFLGTDGLTDTQIARKKELSDRHAAWEVETDPKVKAKLKLTDNMTAELASLVAKQELFDKGEVELPAGAKSYIEEQVDQMVYGYKPELSNKEVRKGHMVEEAAIELANLYFMTEWVKSESSLEYGPHVGHPDVEDDDQLMIVDNKSPWSKKTFVKLPEYISNSTYEWQGKMYCYMKSKMTGKEYHTFRLMYTLMTTPEELIPDYEADDLHYMEDLPLNLRITYKDYKLTDEDISHIERRTSAALKYADEYYNKLMSK
jgi:hypothetical protein